jgi:hypothetical protein
MVSIEAKPGILTNIDIDAVKNKMGVNARYGANLLLRTFENNILRSDYRVTILSRG